MLRRLALFTALSLLAMATPVTTLDADAVPPSVRSATVAPPTDGAQPTLPPAVAATQPPSPPPDIGAPEQPDESPPRPGPLDVPAPSPGVSRQPDIVIVLVDDLGAIDERILERLPNIRELWLQNGLRFDAAYAETPLCCPNRAALLTGQHTRRHGVIVNDATLLDPTHTIATALDDAGYWTVYVGKYLNRSIKLADYTPPGWDRVAMSHDGGKPSQWSVQGLPIRYGYHDRKALEHAAYEAAHAERRGPLLMWLNPRAPHYKQMTKPWVAHVERRYKRDRRCAGIPPWRPPSYAWPVKPGGFPLVAFCRALLTTDEMVGALRAEMARQGRDPIWVFASDNGMAWGAHGTPLKNVPAAGRMPLYISGPGVVSGATDALISSIDIAPTLADLAGALLPHADGVSFRDVLDGRGTGREVMVEDHPLGGASGVDTRIAGWWGVRTPRWHLVTIGDQPPQLFDLSADEWEVHDVAALHPDVVAELAQLYDDTLP